MSTDNIDMHATPDVSEREPAVHAPAMPLRPRRDLAESRGATRSRASDSDEYEPEAVEARRRRTQPWSSRSGQPTRSVHRE